MEFIRQHIALLAGAYILWFGYGHLTEEPAAAAEQKKLQAIGPRYLAIRPDDQPVLRLMDPFRFSVLEPEPAEDASTATGSLDDEGGMDSRSHTASREEGSGSPPLQASSPDRPASSGSGRGPNPNRRPKAGSGRGPNPNRSPKAGSGRGPNPNGGASVVGFKGGATGPRSGLPPVFITDSGPDSLPTMESSIRLWVDAVLAVPGGGSARISGVRVEVGEAIPGLDETNPPLLVSVRGMQATVRYRTVDYTLTLDAPPIVIEPRSPEDAE